MWLALLLGAAALPAPQISRAEEPVAAADSGGLEEVIVTARKRSEDVQKISDPVTVVTSYQIEHTDVQNVQGVARPLWVLR